MQIVGRDDYNEWLAEFGDETRHVFVNSTATGAAPIMTSSALLQARLNCVHPRIFPMHIFGATDSAEGPEKRDLPDVRGQRGQALPHVGSQLQTVGVVGEPLRRFSQRRVAFSRSASPPRPLRLMTLGATWAVDSQCRWQRRPSLGWPEQHGCHAHCQRRATGGGGGQMHPGHQPARRSRRRRAHPRASRAGAARRSALASRHRKCAGRRRCWRVICLSKCSGGR